MNQTAAIAPADIDTLLADGIIGSTHPWNSGDAQAIEGHYRRVCADVERTCRVKSRTVWDHYGSGYASFVDAWFYRPEPAFAVPQATDYENEYVGLVALLSRSSPYFVLAEGSKGWSGNRGYSYMPSLDSVDRFNNPAVRALARDCTSLLETYGLRRISAAELCQPLPPGTRMSTNLTDRAYTYFDALFHWDD
jgi:hypothetical protein